MDLFFEKGTSWVGVYSEKDMVVRTTLIEKINQEDNKKENWGSESWQLVQTMKGWKIQSVSFSINSN